MPGFSLDPERVITDAVNRYSLSIFGTRRF